MPSRVGILAFVTLAACACTDKPAAEPSAAPPAAAPPPVPAKAEPAAPAPIAEAELQTLLTAWLSAQNQGRFDAYEALYAAKVYAVKRAGDREQRFDRGGWLSERRGMFQRPMQVQALDPGFRSSSMSAEITFKQQGSSGKLADSAPKRLLVVREGGELKIAQEETLRSELTTAKPVREFYFTLALDSGFYLSLPHAQVPERSQELGPLESEDGEKNSDVFSASRVVKDSALEPSVRGLKTKKFQLEGGCLATVSEFRAITRVVPHFGERERWNGAIQGEDKKGQPMTNAQIARAVDALGKAQLFAKLSGCGEGRFAWVSGAQQPVAAQLLEDPALSERALAAFGRLPSVLSRQKEFMKQAQHAEGKWWEEGTEVAIFKHPTSGQVLISVLANLREDCGGWSASEWAIFEAKGKALKRVPVTHGPPDRVQDALDIDGDGRLELLGESDYGTDSIVYWPNANELGTSLQYAYLDCPC